MALSVEDKHAWDSADRAMNSIAGGHRTTLARVFIELCVILRSMYIFARVGGSCSWGVRVFPS